MTGKVKIPEAVPPCPSWAGGFGVDRYGVFADLIWGDVVQRMRWIPPGDFMMGAGKDDKEQDDDESPQHSVTIEKGFWLGDTPVTQQLYKAVTGENPSRFSGDDKTAHPVEQVTWHESRQFCEKVTGLCSADGAWTARLPSEAEWEYACRAGTATPRYSEEPLERLAWFNENSGDATHPVKEKFVSPWGLYDMLGNVWEWCEDQWHDSYDDAPIDGSAWVDSTDEGLGRVFRGGAWGSGAGGCRAAYRNWWTPVYRWYHLGFRVALAPSKTGGIPPFEHQPAG